MSNEYEQSPKNQKTGYKLRNCIGYNLYGELCGLEFKSLHNGHRMCGDCRKRGHDGLNGGGSTGKWREARKY